MSFYREEHGKTVTFFGEQKGQAVSPQESVAALPFALEEIDANSAIFTDIEYSETNDRLVVISKAVGAIFAVIRRPEPWKRKQPG